MNRLQDKVAVITGASTGIGRAIALAFADEGAKVVCGDLRRDPSPDAVNEDGPTHEAIRAAGGQGIYTKCDVTKLAEMQSLIQTAVET